MMDIRLISCFLFFMVLFTTDIYQQVNGQALTQPTQALPKQGNSPAVTKPTQPTQPTQALPQQGNSPPVTKPTQPTQALQQQGNNQAVTKLTQAQSQQRSGQVVTKATGITTPASKQCVKGNCTGKGDDESCLENIPGKCLFAGSCTKDVTKNATHTVVTVGCGKGACPTKPTTTTTTVKPPTPAPSTTTTSTCCETDLCNQYQTQSAAFGLRTNLFYVTGLLIFKVCM